MTTEDKTQEELTAEEQEFADWFKDSISEMFGELFEIKDKEHYDDDALNEDEGVAINRFANRFHRKLIADRKFQSKRLLDAIEERGPKDLARNKDDTDSDYFYGIGSNGANREWRSILKELREEL